MNTSRSNAALFDVHATHSNHDMFHTAHKTDHRWHSLAGRKTSCTMLTYVAIRSHKPYDRLGAKETQKKTQTDRKKLQTEQAPPHPHNKQKEEKKRRRKRR